MAGSPSIGTPQPDRGGFDVRRVALTVLIGSLCVGALIAIVAIVGGGDIDETTAKILGTVAAVSVYALAGLACGSLGNRRPDLALLGNAGLVIAALALLITIGEIWARADEDGDEAWQAITVSLIASLGASQVCLLLRRSPRDDASATALVRVASIALTLILGAILIVDIAADEEVVGAQAVAVVAVLWLLATLLLPLMRVLERLGQTR